MKCVSAIGIGLTVGGLICLALRVQPDTSSRYDSPRKEIASTDDSQGMIEMSNHVAPEPLEMTPDCGGEIEINPARSTTLPPLACFAEGTDPAIVEAYMNAWLAEIDMTVAYNLVCRWTTSPNVPGTPRHLTWSLIPDGVTIPSQGTGPTEANVLFASMDSKFSGNRALWIQRFQESFDRWGQISGLSFTRETFGGNDWDDGAVWGSSGQVGLRGDIRISMRTIDGSSDILAFNNFPCSSSPGDMVMDKDESWGSASNNHRFFRNVVMHELGHGIGFAHVCSNNTFQLMEPEASTGFDGPQHDEMRGVHEYYGDPFEPDNTVAQATDVGTIAVGSSLDVSTTPPPDIDNFTTYTSIDENGEEDYFRFTIAEPAMITATVTPKGRFYDGSTQNGDGTCNNDNLVNSLIVANLNVQLIDSNGVDVLDTGAANGVAQAETVDATRCAAGDYFIRVYEGNSPGDAQLYDLTISVAAVDPCACANCVDQMFCNGLETCDVQEGEAVCIPGSDPCPSPAEDCEESSMSCVPAPGACCLLSGTCEIRASQNCTGPGEFYYGDGTNCTGPLDPACEPPDTQLFCQLSSSMVFPGDTVTVELLLTEAVDVFSYQGVIGVSTIAGSGGATLDCTNCGGGSNDPDCGARVDDLRPDYVFTSMSDVPAASCSSAEVSSNLISGAGVNVGTIPGYLGEFTLTITDNTMPGSQVEVVVANGPGDSFLQNSSGQPLGFQTGTSCILTVGDFGPARRPNPEDVLAVASSCTTDEECLNTAYCIPDDMGLLPGSCYVPKNRWLSIAPNPANNFKTARRVRLDLGGGEMADLGWVGPPTARQVGSGEIGPLMLSRLESSPYYANWNDLPLSLGTATNVVHVGTCAVSPQHTYFIQAITIGHDIGNEGNYSFPLGLATTGKWGDLGGNTIAGVTEPPQGVVNFGDVLLGVKAFQSSQTASKVWLDIEPETPDFGVVNFADVLKTVFAFQSQPYPFSAPCDCPGATCP